MIKKDLGYPISYGDQLTPEMADNNRKQVPAYSAYLAMLWSLLTSFFSGPSSQDYSSYLNSSRSTKHQIERVVKTRSSEVKSDPDFNQGKKNQSSVNDQFEGTDTDQQVILAVNYQFEGTDTDQKVILAKAADAFQVEVPLSRRSRGPVKGPFSTSPGSPGQPGGGDSGGDDGGPSSFPQPPSVEKTQQDLDSIYQNLEALQQKMTESDSESEYSEYESESEYSEDESQSEDECSNSEQEQIAPPQVQADSFRKGGNIDWEAAHDEVYRRAAKYNNPDFECSIERLQHLATECGIQDSSSLREAIGILDAEAKGFVKDARRPNYGPEVKGIDFEIVGLGKYAGKTHGENKGPVGSEIARATNQSDDLVEQGTRIAKKFERQRNNWSNTTYTSQIRNLDPAAPLPKSPNNVLALVDLIDVPEHEKDLMLKSILEASKDDAAIEFLNTN